MKTQKTNRKIWEKPEVTSLPINKETKKKQPDHVEGTGSYSNNKLGS